MTPKQVQGVWLSLPPKGSADEVRRHLSATVNVLRDRFPNLRLVWASSPCYGGHATGGEPTAFEAAFAVRGLVREQEASSPVVLWGPYLWADASVWKRDDFLPDGVQLGDAGRAKAAAIMLRFFKEDESARGWFVRRPR
jgi:hypothetical protein